MTRIIPARSPVVLIVTIAVGLFGFGAEFTMAQDGMDWAFWRGPFGNGMSAETGLVDSFDPGGENVLWESEELATRSTPIVMNGKLFTLARKNPGEITEAERVICADAATGDILWEHVFNVYLSDVPDTRVAWSSVVGDPGTGNVYAQGVCGYFCCLDSETGEVVWERSLHEEFGLVSTYGGRTNKPVIFQDLVLASAVTTSWGSLAVPAHRFMAFDKLTGEIVWFSGTRISPYDTTYSTPVVTTLAGQDAIVFGSGDGGVWALQPRTGKEIWHYDLARRGLNVSPLVVGNTVYMNHGEENVDDTTMGAVVALDGSKTGDITQTGELWRIKERVAGRSSPLMIDGKLYLIDDKGGLWILDPKTGKQIVYDSDGNPVEGDGRRANRKLGTAMFSNPIYADGKIYCVTADGRAYVLRPTNQSREGFEILHRTRVDGESNGSPIVSHGRIYIPTSEKMYCLGQTSATPPPPGSATTNAGGAVQRSGESNPPDEAQDTARIEVMDSIPSEEAVHLQLVPAEALLKPGGSVTFRARLFNNLGQLVSESAAEFSVEGPATITADGKLTANADAAHDAAFITAKVGELTGTARVRIVPPLPWHFDFEDGDVPISWVGMRNRHIPETLDDGSKVIFKRDVIPTPRGDTKLGTRSQGWMGPIDMSNYTVQADVMPTELNGWMPIMGITAQRYILEIRAQDKELRISTWGAQLRMAKSTEFEVQPGAWYTMKLKASMQDGKALLQAKVWPRDESEPDDWTLTAEDPSPNTHGAPGFFGNTQMAPYYMDNVSVTPNN